MPDAPPTARARTSPRRCLDGAAARPGLDRADHVNRLARRFRSAHAGRIVRATASTMPMPQLKVRAISPARYGPAPAGTPSGAAAPTLVEIDPGVKPFRGSTRGYFQQAAAGDVGQRMDAPLADRGSRLFT
jgi:hypothetical protein